MASVRTCMLFLAIIIHISAGTFVKVDSTSENLGQYGQDSVLKCGINPTIEATVAMITYVKWKKTGNEKPLVVFLKDGPSTNEPRFRFSVGNLTGTSRDVSLLVSNTEINDTGEYECTVKTDSGSKDTIKTNLIVTAKYSKPIVYSIPERDIPYNTDVTLVCNSEGGYPMGRIRWFDQEKKEWTSSSTLEVEPMDDERFNLTSKLSLLKNSVFAHYVCSVENASRGEDWQMKFDLPFKDTISGDPVVGDAVSKIVVPVLVIGLLIVGFLMALLFKIRRSNGGHTSTGQDYQLTSGQDDQDTDLVRTTS